MLTDLKVRAAMVGATAGISDCTGLIVGRIVKGGVRDAIDLFRILLSGPVGLIYGYGGEVVQEISPHPPSLCDVRGK